MFEFILVMYGIYLMYCRMIQLTASIYSIPILGQKRHHRRRFVTSEYLIDLQRVMKTGALLKLATDIPDYVDNRFKKFASIIFHGRRMMLKTGESVGAIGYQLDMNAKPYERGAGRII